MKYIIKVRHPPFDWCIHTQTDDLQWAMTAAGIIAKTHPCVHVYHDGVIIVAYNGE